MSEEQRRPAGFQLDDDRWLVRLAELLEFVDQEGRLPVQSLSAPAEERRLSYWLSNQRAEHKCRLLAGHRIDELNQKLPGWGSTAQWRAIHS
ncbi:helicase associated domain-containing protein [Nakamurella alba]|uniref:helicase associated domain-containing protein n=1 Tax=Nakamurella alba TaxID=2665158 RepID=UPI0018AA17D1|nr:helicase associated domain-containing protein [Nakamurella alba]